MLKNKIIVHSLCTMFFMAAPLAVAVTPGNAAWDVKTIDYETHNNSTNLAEGSYLDRTNEGPGWRNYAWPESGKGAYRFLSHYDSGVSRTGYAIWSVQIPRTGWYNIKTSYRASHNRTSDADYAIYRNETANNILAFRATPEYKRSVNQTTSQSTEWADMGTHCLQENDISLVVLDGRDDGQSDSVDASSWIFRGTEYNSKRCGKMNMTPINHILLKQNIR